MVQSGERALKSEPSNTKYDKPPVLVGYTYDPAEAYRARDENRLLAIRLETNRSCNLRCRYCYAEGGEHLDDELPFEVLADVVAQAHDLGARSVVVIGGGEPTLHPRFRELVAYIHSLGMVPAVFSNTINVTPELAGFLFSHNASVMGKLDSLRAEVQDFLAGEEGAFEQIQRGLRNLMDAGFCDLQDRRLARLGVSFVSNRMNLGEIEEIWHFCRSNNIFPNMEVLTPTGRAKEYLADKGLETGEIQEYKYRLLEIDRKHYGFDWLPHTPLIASGCLQHLYSLYVTIEGNVRPCAPTKFDEHPDLKVNGAYPHNIRLCPLSHIYNSSIFLYTRNIDLHLEGKCGGCEHKRECIGCRGYVYSVGVNEGKDPYAALRGECLQCSK